MAHTVWNDIKQFSLSVLNHILSNKHGFWVQNLLTLTEKCRMWDILKFSAYQKVWSRFGNMTVVFNTSFKMRQMQNNLIKMCIQSTKWNIFWTQIPAVMKCTSMKVSNKAICNPCFFFFENRENVNYLLFNRTAFCVCTVYTTLCFLQNPALKINLESSWKCRGKYAISCASTSSHLITCDYKHAVDYGETCCWLWWRGRGLMKSLCGIMDFQMQSVWNHLQWQQDCCRTNFVLHLWN